MNNFVFLNDILYNTSKIEKILIQQVQQLFQVLLIQDNGNFVVLFSSESEQVAKDEIIQIAVCLKNGSNYISSSCMSNNIPANTSNFKIHDV